MFRNLNMGRVTFPAWSFTSSYVGSRRSWLGLRYWSEAGRSKPYPVFDGLLRDLCCWSSGGFPSQAILTSPGILLYLFLLSYSKFLWVPSLTNPHPQVQSHSSLPRSNHQNFSDQPLTSPPHSYSNSPSSSSDRSSATPIPWPGSLPFPSTS